MSPLMPIVYGPRDWPEDHGHENGDYFNECCHCNETFMGHKRRVSCHVCVDKARAAWAALNPEEKEEKTRQTIEEINRFYAERDKTT